MKADPGGYLRTLRALTAEQDPNKIGGLAGRIEAELSILSSSGWTEEELRNLVRAERIAQAIAIVAGYVQSQGKRSGRVSANGGLDFE